MDDSRIKSAQELLSAFFDEEKLKRGGRYASFFASWRDLVGSRLAAHSRVADVDKGVLVVEAEHPGWIQLLQLRQSEILETLASRFPELELRSIAFRLGRARPGQAASPEAEGGGPGPGPFGPWGRPLPDREEAGAPGPEPSEGGRGSEAGRAGEEAGGATAAPEGEARKGLEEIGDPALRELLGSLKRSIEEGRG